MVILDRGIKKMAYTNSELVTHVKLSPNKNSPRNHSIDTITVHCVVGQVGIEWLGNWFARKDVQASSNYGIDKNGRIGMFVPESDRSWCSSSSANDNRAITIECASDSHHPYAVNEKVYNALIDLCVDICKRNGKTKLIWFANKEKTLAYKPKSNEMVMTVHRWFANKSCPGDYLYQRHHDIAEKVTARLETVQPKDSSTKEDLDTKIWNFLVSKGLNDYAVAGIMGNLKAESNLRPNNLQNSFEKKLGYTDESYTKAVDSGKYTKFATDGAGYGLAQWTYHTRKAALLAFAKTKKMSIANAEMQLEFLWKEMQNYTGMMNTLHNAKSVLEASNSFLFSFERPADQGKAVQNTRHNLSMDFFNRFATTPQETTKLYTIQIGAYGSKSNAEKRLKYVKQIGFPKVYIFEDDSGLYKVRTMPVTIKDQAENMLKKLKNAGFDKAFIV